VKIEAADLEVLAEMMAQANLEAVGCEAKAEWCRAVGDHALAEDQDALAAMYQGQARAICNALALLDGTGEVDPQIRPAEPEGRPRLTLISSEKTA